MSRKKAVGAVAAVLVLLTAAALLGVVTKSEPSEAQSGAENELAERGAGSEAFARHVEDLFSAHVGQAGENPTSWAEQNYELNGGDAISAENIVGARQAFSAIQKRGTGKGKRSTTTWFSLGPTSSIYPAFLNRHGSQYITSGRITGLEISPDCSQQSCTMWVGAAGGGIWRTDKALSGNGNWVNVSDGSVLSGAIGALTYDAAHNTLYAGTGEDAAAGDAEAGVGIYKSTDGGSTWTPLAGNASFALRAIRDITIDPQDPSGNTIWVASGRGVHGISSTTAGAVSMIPGGPGVGIWKSTDGGASFTLVQPVTITFGPLPGQQFPSSFGSTRGGTVVRVDPTHPGVIYAGVYNVGVWRSTDNGTTWTNIHPCSVDPIQPPTATVPVAGTCGAAADRTEFALATTPDGHTRMYQTEGDTCSVNPTANPPQLCTTGYSRFFIADAVESGTPTFVDKTSTNPADPGYATWNFCTGQCWYDQFVVSPAGHPNMVYIGGSYTYNEDHRISNARALLLSRDGGNTFTDVTDDGTGTDDSHNGLHPDHHRLVVNPNNPLQFFDGSDGGLMRSDGTLVDVSARCDGRSLSGAALDRCKQLLSAVPGEYTSLNKGLQTLQFQSLSVNPANSKNVQGGTQDNGTFETTGSSVVWPQTIFGDGGLSGFDPVNPAFRFHTYFAQQVDVSFASGDPPSWDWISDPLFAESALFYFPIISDPTVGGTLFAGLTHVWRTLDDGGPQAYLDANCNEFTGTFTPGTVCGDWVRLGDPSTGGRLTCTPSAQAGCVYGTTRSGGNVGWLSRAPSDNATLWASTTTGRLFISKNANAASEAAVTFTRLDTLAANSPGRAISSISVDPANTNHAYVSYLSYSAITPSTPGHVFSVTYDPAAGTATWTLLDGSGAGAIGDQPVNAVAYDNVAGDLYASTDFGVVKLADVTPANGWTLAAEGLPVVTVAGLTINPGARQLLAATHGRGAYQLTLP